MNLHRIGFIVWLTCYPICSVFSSSYCIAASTRNTGRIEKHTEFGTGARVGSSLVRYNNSCIYFNVYFVSGEFFSGLHKVETPGAPRFEKGKSIYYKFPDTLMVDVEAIIFRCEDTPEQPLPPDYGAGLMAGASWKVSWKTRGDIRPVSLVSTTERHRVPSLRWEYFLEVRAKDVPLTDGLVIDVSLRHGISHARLLASLN